MSTHEDLAWRTSSYSGGEGQCVQAAGLDTGSAVALRDSKDPVGPRIILPGHRWVELLAGVKAGSHDLTR